MAAQGRSREICVFPVMIIMWLLSDSESAQVILDIMVVENLI